MKIIAATTLEVPNGKTCMSCASGGWKEYCSNYQVPKPNSPYPNRRLSFCNLFKVEIDKFSNPLGEYPLKCDKCLNAEKA